MDIYALRLIIVQHVSNQFHFHKALLVAQDFTKDGYINTFKLVSNSHLAEGQNNWKK